MKKIRSLCSKIIRRFYQDISLFRVIIQSMIYKNKLYLFGTPIHGNLGDQAILLAEEQFLQDNFKNMHVIEIESSTVKRFHKILPKIIKQNTILVHGGGFLGTLWLEEEKMFRDTLKVFPDNHIIVLPQTIYFDRDEVGNVILEESKEIYSEHKHLYICCREKYSYEFMLKEFPTCNVLLVPDMVLYLDGTSNNAEKEILFCIRSDKEKVEYKFDSIYSQLASFHIDNTDMIINKNVFKFNREKVVNNKINQFSHYKFIVTDRLHGMIFSLLAGVPCLVLENKSYKIKGVYHWIENIDTICLYNENSLEHDIQKLLTSKKYRYTNEQVKPNYNYLITIINQCLRR